MAMKIKICGMKFPDNISSTVRLQPDYLGFIFYDKSPRYFENSVPDLDKAIQKVGVFVNASLEDIEAKVTEYQLDFVQLHGTESPEFCASVTKHVSKVIKAFSIHNEFNFNNLEKYNNCCSFYLFDTKGKHYGGNGTAFDWSVLQHYTSHKPYFLSGGIGPENIRELQAFLKKDYAQYCHAIDLNSRFETAPGLKNTEALTAFISHIKQKL